MSLLTFHSLSKCQCRIEAQFFRSTYPKPTIGIWWPLFNLTLGVVMLAYALVVPGWIRMGNVKFLYTIEDRRVKTGEVLLALIQLLLYALE